MGYIYKISNNVNDMVYIGMTTRTVNSRKIEHENSYTNKKSRMYDFKIYKAMRDIGIENFTYEIIEECDNNMLCEREKYWIEYYDSVFKIL